jgi:peptidyl-prolyl cis-trans isomerase C
LAVLALFAFSCTGGTTSAGGSASVPAKNCDKVLAEIGGSKICMSEFQARLDKIPPFYRKRVATKKGKLEYLNRMVEDELFYLDALSKGVDKDPEVVDQLAQIKKSILAGKIKKDLMDQEFSVTDDDVKKYFDEHQDEFQSPETVTVRHILFRVKHKATDDEKKEKVKKANEVYQQIKSGKLSFEDAAKKFSEDKASAKKGGKLAPVKKGIKSAEFEKAAFGLSKKGEVSEVFKDRRGYNIVQFIEKTEPSLKEFDKVEARIKRKLQQEGRKAKMDEFTAKLRESNKVTINEDMLTDDEGAEEPAAPAGLPLIDQGAKKGEAQK